MPRRINRVTDQAPPQSLSPRADAAYDLILDLILDCTISPGESVSERGLATQYDLGIASARSALSRLASEGLVTAIPRVGYLVQPITLRGVEAFFETWAIIGPEFNRLALARLTEKHRRRIAAIPELPETAPTREVIDRAEALFEILASAVDNPILVDIYRRLQRDLRRLFSFTFRGTPGLHFPSLDVSEIGTGMSADEFAEASKLYIAEVGQNTMRLLLRDSSLADVPLTFSSN